MGSVIEFPDAISDGLGPLALQPQRGSVENLCFGTGWWEFDEIFKFYPGQFAVVTGIAGHGKSTLMLNAFAKMGHEQGVGTFMYVPENEAYLLDKLRRMWIYGEEPFSHYIETYCILQNSLARDEKKGDFTHDIAWVLNRAAEAVQRYGVEIVFIDPWNELDRARAKGELMSDYIGSCLMQVKDFCRTMNVSVVIVAHPTKAVNENGGRVAGLADIEGSMNWFNKCDNGLIVVRDPEKNTARVISAKVRELGAGRIGVCHFHVDPKTGIFSPMEGAVTP